VLRTVLSGLFVALLTAAIYSYFAIGHCYPALGVALLAGTVTGLFNPLATRQRAPRMIVAIVFLAGFWISHEFTGVPDKGPHRLAYDTQYLMVFLVAGAIVRRLRALRAN